MAIFLDRELGARLLANLRIAPDSSSVQLLLAAYGRLWRGLVSVLDTDVDGRLVVNRSC